VIEVTEMTYYVSTGT